MQSYRLGSKGEAIKKIQEKLKAFGICRGPFDAIFGGGTEGAVKLFQLREGLEVDGIVGPETRGKLRGEG
jgi:N-acetylmuramoyl-L-alanine amidase